MYGRSITHEGVIESISDKKLFIRLSRLPACADCHARGICPVPDTAGGELMVTDRAEGLEQGDRVVVSVTRPVAYKAVWLGYVLPLILVLATMILFTALRVEEWVSALLSVSVLAPYFILIRLLDRRIERSVTFSVSKPA
jgi:sigma-E factor negative regulatory protein RseC